MITGGGNINSNTPGIRLTDIIDLKAANPAYQPGPDLPGDGKMYVNAHDPAGPNGAHDQRRQAQP